jgi:hypothetical protein
VFEAAFHGLCFIFHFPQRLRAHTQDCESALGELETLGKPLFRPMPSIMQGGRALGTSRIADGYVNPSCFGYEFFCRSIGQYPSGSSVGRSLLLSGGIVTDDSIVYLRAAKIAYAATTW